MIVVTPLSMDCYTMVTGLQRSQAEGTILLIEIDVHEDCDLAAVLSDHIKNASTIVIKVRKRATIKWMIDDNNARITDVICIAEPYAQISSIVYQQLSHVEHHQLQIHCIAQSHAMIRCDMILRGRSHSKYVYRLDAIQEYASVEMAVAGQCTNDQRASVVSYQQHSAIHTATQFNIRTVLSQRSHMIYNGLIRIDKNATRSNAHQRHAALLLDAGVYTHAVPAIEVETNNVQCTHASAIGKPDADLMWFLMHRGLSEQEALQLIVRGFFNGMYESTNQEIAELLL